MKKIILLILMIFTLPTFSGCESTSDFQSQPVGYGLLDKDHVGVGSFTYISTMPYNPNSFFLTVYALPHIWAEVKVIGEVSENNPNIAKLVDGYLVRYFAQYILIGDILFYLVVDSSTNPKGVSYVNEAGIDILELLVTEEQAKWYIEQSDNGDAYIVDHEHNRYNIYKSILYKEDTNNYMITRSSGLFISYHDINDEMPDFANNFKYYEPNLVRQLFNRALAKAFDPIYKTNDM
ncbi:MAG: hypothetical protein Q7I99_05675 [Acholeplasmataceae bacterium]|nr:hypothetical protein [Acholeplasmataceae bacterium]